MDFFIWWALSGWCGWPLTDIAIDDDDTKIDSLYYLVGWIFSRCRKQGKKQIFLDVLSKKLCKMQWADTRYSIFTQLLHRSHLNEGCEKCNFSHFEIPKSFAEYGNSFGISKFINTYFISNSRVHHSFKFICVATGFKYSNKFQYSLARWPQFCFTFSNFFIR